MFNFYLRGLKIAGLDLVKSEWKSLAQRPHLAPSIYFIRPGALHLATVTVTAAHKKEFLPQWK